MSNTNTERRNAAPPALTESQALDAAKNAFPAHGELQVVKYEPIVVEGKPLWVITVSNGERETSVAFPRALEEKV